MRKYFLFFCFLSFFFFPLKITFAEDDVKLPEKIEIFFQEFFHNNLEKNYATSYTLTSEDFKEQTSSEDFQALLDGTGLTTFVDKKWTAFEERMFGLLVIVQGVFTTPNNETHEIQFELVTGPHEIKIKSITENISYEKLKRKFPQKKILKELVRKDLDEIILLIQNNQYKKFHQYLSNNAKKVFSIRKIRYIVNRFKKQNVDIAFIENSHILLWRFSPRLNNKGQMVVRGNYKNSNYKVNFILAYDYEWQWRLGMFTLKVTPIDKEKSEKTETGTSTTSKQ